MTDKEEPTNEGQDPNATNLTQAHQSDFFEDSDDPELQASGRYRRGQTFNEIEALKRQLRQVYPELNLEDETIERFATEAVDFYRKRHRIKPREALVEYDRYMGEYVGTLVMEGFKTGKMPLPLFYIFTEPWAEVCNAKDYPLQEKAIGILEKDTGDMLDIVTPPESESLHIYDFGVGTGRKGEIVVREAITKNGRDIEYHGVDASEEMLRMALGGIATRFLKEALALKTAKRKVRRSSKWWDLIRFLRQSKREFSRNPEYLPKAFKNIFGKHYDNPQGIDLFKFLIARMLGMHNSNPKEVEMMSQLDGKVHLPLKIHAHPEWFQDLEATQFEPNEKEGVVIFDLGSEICNQFPGDSVKMFHDLLSDPETPEHTDGIVPLEEEKHVKAPYAVLGLQLGEVPTSQTQFRKMRTQMRKAYNNPEFRALTTHPFLRKDIQYIGANGEELNFEDIGYIYVDYEEDPDNPGYYGATHRLYITENVKVINGARDTLHIPGRERFQEVFEKIVDALFDPEREEEVIGRRNEIMRVLNISTKEELLELGPSQFFFKDYSNYRSGMHIAEDILGEPNNFEQTLLYPSYKPSLEQITDLCHKNGLKVIKVYGDGENESEHTYVKILTRKMTQSEKDLYASGDYDASIFFIPKNNMTIDPSVKKQTRRAKRRARHSGSKLEKQPLPKKESKKSAAQQFQTVQEKRRKRSTL